MLEHVDQSPLETNEAEQGLLGAILSQPNIMAKIVGRVEAADFWVSVHGRIYSHCKKLFDAGTDPSPLILAPYFENDPDLKEFGGGKAYLIDLLSACVLISNAPHYAKTIREMAQRRRAREIYRDAYEMVSDPDNDFSMTIAQADYDLEELVGGSTDFVTQHEGVTNLIDTMQRGNLRDATGIKIIDGAMGGGLYRGFTYCFAAKPKVGKTTLAHSISHNLNEAGVRHAYIALEMGKDQIIQRQIARAGGFNSLDFLENGSPEFLANAARIGLGLGNNCLYRDLPDASLASLKMALTQAVKRERIFGFILDYWQLVGSPEKGQTQEAHLSAIAQWIAGFCRKNNVWSIVIAQLNKEDNAFGSAGINRACDQFYKLYRSEVDERSCWLDLEHSRYTHPGSIGDEKAPSLRHVERIGPFITDF